MTLAGLTLQTSGAAANGGAELRDPHDDRTIFTGEAALCARDRGRAY